MPELSEATQRLVGRYKFFQQSQYPKQGTTTIHVDEVALKIAAVYEQVRTIVDWKEEHLMRRAAIIRKLKRRFFDMELNNFSDTKIAEPLVLELIRGGHFPNDKIEESKIDDVQRITDKYVFILKNSPENKKGKAGLHFYNWLIEIAACEIEETLSPAIKERAMIDYMFELMRQRIKVSDSIYERGILRKEDTDVLIFVAIQQALFKLDAPIISYNLIIYKYPNWNDNKEESLLKISQNIYKIWHKVEETLNHRMLKKFYVICEKYDTPYLLLGDILSTEDISGIAKQIQEPAVLESLVKSVYVKRLSTMKERLKRAAVYSTISIFLTKMLTLVLLEVVLAEIFTGKLDFPRLIADLLIPTVLMFGLVATIKRPSRKNLNIVIMETMKIVYKKEKPDTYEIKISRRKNTITKSVLSSLYLLGASVSFGAIYWLFSVFGFPIYSIVINMIFIALILFAGTAVRRRAQELTVEEGYEGFLSFVSDILFLPIAGVGRWLSNKWKQYNAIAAFFNALIDMPFSVFIEFIEGWRYFIRERKEEIR